MRLGRALAVTSCVAVAVAVAGAWRPSSPASDRSSAAATTDDIGRRIWLGDCAVCHGRQGSGTSRGPDITESGTAAVDFMVSTGRMPLTHPDSKLERHDPRYDQREIRALVAYAATFVHGPLAMTPALRHADLSKGGSLYLGQCAACHQSAGAGGALANGDVAPPLGAATAREIAGAVRTGPGNMPRFSKDSIDDSELADITAYVRHLRDPGDRGGLSLGHLGPVPEGLVALGIGLVACILVTRWLGTKAEER